MSEERDADADLAMCEAATPGPWQYHLSHIYGPEPERPLIGQITGMPLIRNRDFVVEAREALPYWIGEAERLAAENAALRARVAELETATKDAP